MYFVQHFFVRGGPVMWPLLACSLVSLTIAIERLIFWWRENRHRNDRLVQQLFQNVEEADYSAAESMAGKGHRIDSTARVLLAGLVHREHGLREGMEAAASIEIEQMKRGLGVLDTIITMSPMLGILGTVIGILVSFDQLSLQGIADPKAVVGGIAQAIITTIAGLIVALITLIPYNYLVARVQKAAASLEQTATHFELAFKRGREHAAGNRI